MDTIWNVIKNVKREISFDKRCDGKNGLPQYKYYEERLSPVEIVEQKLNLNSSDYRYQNMSMEILKKLC